MEFTGSEADIDAALDGLQFTPDSGFSGNAGLSFKASNTGDDAGDYSTQGFVPISVSGTPLVPTEIDLTTVQGQTLTRIATDGLLGGVPGLSVSAINGDSSLVGQPTTLDSGAGLAVQADGSVIYTPPTGFVGDDSFLTGPRFLVQGL
jgi:hypothetical protein